MTGKSGTSVLHAIGRTPLIELNRLRSPEGARVFLKLEYLNPTGSYKDRMALALIEGAEARGALHPGMRVVEYTGGSTGSSLAMVCAIKGYRFTPVLSDAFARERVDTLRALGAEPILVPTENGKVTPELLERMKAELARQRALPGVFWTDQFHNDDGIAGYRAIGDEILEQVGSKIDVFCAGVGTGGMLVGVSRGLKAAQCRCTVVALEPSESPTLTTGRGGPHRVEGVGVGFRPPHLMKADYDEIRTVSEEEAVESARKLAREEGVLAGTSTGLNVAAALRIAAGLSEHEKVVTVACDSGLKYLNGDLYRPEG